MSISRRTVVKGAAWTAPAVAVAAQAPALAASSTCPTAADLAGCGGLFDTWSTGWTAAIGVDDADEAYWDARANFSDKGTYYTARLGRLDLRACAPEGATGFRLTNPGTAIVRTANGKVGEARVTGVSTQGAQALGAPANVDAYLQTTIPYRIANLTDGNKLQSLSFPLLVTYLKGLDEQPFLDADGNPCPPVTVYANYCYDVGALGLQATGLSAPFTVTAGAVDPCA
ncbi:hypothetical protein BJF82_03195 [Kytococcus sp. CUA-901]|nr:hypothetical protein BJF82_03195 [Kytococcus sp. CUA-901]